MRYKDGVILDVLMQIVGSGNNNDFDHEINEDVRTTAAKALFNISCSSIVKTTDCFGCKFFKCQETQVNLHLNIMMNH